MKSTHRTDRLLACVLTLAASVAAGGCAEELGAEVMRTTSVRGTVRQSGKPIQRGWIEFIPADGTVGNQRSARIEDDGTFSADRVPVGSVAIRLIDITVSQPFPIDPRYARRLFAGFPPPIRRVIPDEPSELNLDLVEEWAAHQALRSAKDSSSAGVGGVNP